MSEEEEELEKDAESAIDVVESEEREAEGGRKSRGKKKGRWIVITEEQLETIPLEEDNFMGKCIVCAGLGEDGNGVEGEESEEK